MKPTVNRIFETLDDIWRHALGRMFALRSRLNTGLGRDLAGVPILPEEKPYFGTCPQCLRTNGYLNIGRDHWFYCRAHKTKWCAGGNLFSSWQLETHADWARNEKRLRRYTEVDPVYLD